MVDFWCDRQLSPWRGRTLNYASALAEYVSLSESTDSVVLFEVADRSVRIARMPGSQGSDTNPAIQERADLYLSFLSAAIAEHPVDRKGIFAMDMRDDTAVSLTAPLFAFQKSSSSPNILLSDVDFLTCFFFVSDMYDDQISYESKSLSGIFVGSTTGDYHTVGSIAQLRNQRLRSGVFFKDKDEVEFLLPTIVQCATIESEEAIRSLGLGNARVSWAEQFSHRFIVSLDGNGATCSRVAVALKSKCVLVKYESSSQLFYFDSLIPWLHYIPVESDEEVLNIVTQERRFPGYYSHVAAESREFFEKYLVSDVVHLYVSQVINSYFGLFDHLIEGVDV